MNLRWAYAWPIAAMMLFGYLLYAVAGRHPHR